MVVEAVILILKHATVLLISKLLPKSALTHAELGYQEANIDLKIQQYLAASSQECSIEQLASFIMATDFGGFILVSVKIICHQVCTESSVPSQSSVKDRFKHFQESLRKMIRKHK
jgi:hypothetical protein